MPIASAPSLLPEGIILEDKPDGTTGLASSVSMVQTAHRRPELTCALAEPAGP